MTVLDMEQVGRLIVRVLRAPTDEAALMSVRGEVHELTKRFPLYPDRPQ